MSVGTAHYAKVEDADLPDVPDNVDRIAGCFIALGYKRACLDIARDPTVNDLRAAVSQLFADAQPDDKIVFYYTGHGETKGERFYLLTTDSELNRLSGTALAADDLMHMVLESKLNHVLLILDTCYSGSGIASLTEVASRYGRDRRGESDLHFIASAQSREEATQEAFAAHFVEAVANRRLQLGGRTQQYLQPSAIISAINGATRQEQRQHPIHSSFKQLLLESDPESAIRFESPSRIRRRDIAPP